MLLYLLFCTILGFIFQFYIIFGTNLLTGGLAQTAVFCLFQCFAEKEYQTKSKRNETFGGVIFGTEAIQETWSRRKGSNEEATRQGGAPPTLVGPAWLPWPTSFAYIYSYTPKHQGEPQKHLFTATTFCTREISSWGLFRRPAGWGFNHGGLLHQHHYPSDEA